MSPTRSPRARAHHLALLLLALSTAALSGCASPMRQASLPSQVELANPTQVELANPTQVAQASTRVAAQNASQVDDDSTRVESTNSYQLVTGANFAHQRSQVVAGGSGVVPDGAPAPSPRLAKGSALSLSPASHDGSTLPADAPSISLGSASQVDPADGSELVCPPAGTRVLLIGDSLSHGLGPVMARIAKQCGTPFFHKGVIGSHVTQWAQDHWLLPQLERAQPTVVMVSLGGNDFQRTDPDNVRRAIPRFLDKVHARGAKLLWISPPTFPFNDKIDVRGMWRDNLAARHNVATFHAEALSIPRGPDRIHPDMQGNRDLSATLWQWLSTHAVALQHNG